MGRDVTVALIQEAAEPFAVERNRDRSVQLARQAFADGADVVVLPELFVPGYALDSAQLERASEPIDGPTMEAWQRVARETGGVVVGGFCERDNVLYNTAVAVGPTGLLVHYRKTHLFSTEKRIFEPGDHGLPIVDTDFGKLAVCVCYDLRFVEVLRSFALRGAELICVPTAWIRGFDAPEPEEKVIGQVSGVLAQSNLNQLFVACASMVGATRDHEFLGSSVIANPVGQAVVGPLSREIDEMKLVTLDLDDIATARERGPLISPMDDRRRDIYGVMTEDGLL